MSLLLFTTATKSYEHFVMPFILSTLIRVPDSGVEVMLSSVNDFKRTNEQAIDFLERNFPNRYRLTQLDRRFVGYPIANLDNAERFLRTPILHADYDFCYITDIDIVTLDPNIESIRIRHAQQLGLCYSNVMRRDAKGEYINRMTGLHFVACRPWYVVVNDEFVMKLLNDLIKEKSRKAWMGDEQLLHRLTEDAFCLPTHTERKIANFSHLQGFHTSPNRSPFREDGGSCDWGIRYYPNRVVMWQELKADERWQAGEKLFDPKYHVIIGQIEDAIARTAQVMV